TDTPPAEQAIVFSTSIFAGTVVSCSAKLSITAVSPLDAHPVTEQVGGQLAAELKYVGYDALVLMGVAEESKVLTIDAEGPRLQPAGYLTGMLVGKTEEVLEQMYQGSRPKTLIIGPAAERGLPCSTFSSGRFKQLGSSGIAAALGSKQLKALSLQGLEDVQVTDIAECMWSTNREEEPLLTHHQLNVEGPPPEAVMSGRADAPYYYLEHLEKRRQEDFLDICDDLSLDAVETAMLLFFYAELASRNRISVNSELFSPEKQKETLELLASGRPPFHDLPADTHSLLHSYPELAEFRDEYTGRLSYLSQLVQKHREGLESNQPKAFCHLHSFLDSQGLPENGEVYHQADPLEGNSGSVISGREISDTEMKKHIAAEHAKQVKYSLGLCNYWPADSKKLSIMFNRAFQAEYSSLYLDRAGERLINLEQIIHVISDSRKPAAQDSESSILSYYTARGWDKHGLPSPELLRQIGFDEEAVTRYLEISSVMKSNRSE
ncbi:MAG: hypothetical protein K9L68_10970, partial [Spirochaetales bacterium]|nr:hypothetical protein [Spirochaetales bacterium]MCF7939107.1 hypothetical protein [Spirochaetales bacterium]